MPKSSNSNKNEKLRPLNRRQQLFCDEYLIDLNGTQAAIRAGYSTKCANEIAARLLAHVSIRAYVDTKLAERSRRLGINADRVIEELAKLALVNPMDVFDSAGGIKDNASRNDTAAITSIKIKTTTRDGETTVEREIRFTDKNKTLDLLARHLGMLNRGSGAGGDNTGLDRLADVLERSAKKYGG